MSPEVQHPDVVSSVQQKFPEEGHKNVPRDGTPPLLVEAERAGAVQPGEKAARSLESSLSVSKEGLRERKG